MAREVQGNMAKRFVNPQSIMTKWAFRATGAVWSILLLWYFVLFPLGIRRVLMNTEFDIFMVLMNTGFVLGLAALVLAIAGYLRKEPDEYNIRTIVVLLVVFSVPAFIVGHIWVFLATFP
jgi:hypothetical protein